eukprot:9487576-Pyramimonas_sp.AAC.4
MEHVKCLYQAAREIHPWQSAGAPLSAATPTASADFAGWGCGCTNHRIRKCNRQISAKRSAETSGPSKG